MGSTTVVFVAPDGTETDFETLPGVLRFGSTGLHMPTFDFTDDDVPGQDGSRTRQVRTRPREVVLGPLVIAQPDEAALRVWLRALARRLNPKRGEGTLRVTTVDGVTRTLQCRYTGGFEGDQANGNTSDNVWIVALAFRMTDPYFRDLSPTTRSFSISAPTQWFPIFPLRLSGDTVMGTITVDNDGDDDAYPIWTVHGPATALTLTNLTTGETLSLPYTLGSTDVLQIDTRPFIKTLTLADGTSLYGGLDQPSSLWSLPAGVSELSVELPGADVTSYVSLSYQRRWLTP